MALPQASSNDRDKHVYTDVRNAELSGSHSLTAHAKERAEARHITRWLIFGAVASVLAESVRRLGPTRNERLNRRAGKLYRKLAEREFGCVKIDRADLPGEAITRLIVPLLGEDTEREVDQALKRVMTIHDQVERLAPELVGRIVFDYASDGRPC
jgi:hypothetical protein